MTDAMLTCGNRSASRGVVTRSVLLLILIGTGGCVQVSAPDKPIEINLNVNVKQEVLVRLQRDARDIIENNPELFPK